MGIELIEEEVVNTADVAVWLKRAPGQNEPAYWLSLRNFPLNGHGLNVAHRRYIDDIVVPYLRNPDSFLEIYAMTDRSGTPAVNYKVSEQRLKAVQQHLVRHKVAGSRFSPQQCKAIGEDLAEHFKVSDGRKEPNHRRVWILLSPSRMAGAIVFAGDAQISYCRTHRPKPVR